MGLFRKIFGRQKEFDDTVNDSPATTEKPSQAREDYYADLEAQQYTNTKNILFGQDDIDPTVAQEMVQKIMPRTSHDLKIVEQGDADGIDERGQKALEVVQDAAPQGAIQGGGLTPEQQSILRNVDLYQAYARINPRILRHFVSRAFIGYPACTLLGQHEIIGLCCSMPPEDAIASGFTLACTSQSHKQNDDHIQAETTWLEQLRDYAYDCNVEELCIKFGTYKRLYGIGIAIPRVKLKDGHTFEEPYDPSFIEPGSFRGFTVIDPSRICWDFDANTLFDPLSEWYQKPEYLHLSTQTTPSEGLGADRRMHRSWVITSNYREVGEDLLATYMYGGQPLSQILYERVFCADTLANEIVALAMSKRTVVMDANVKELLMQPKKVEHLIQRINHFRTNMSVFLKDIAQNGQVTQLETSLADLQPLSAQQFQYAAAYAGIPVTKLLKNVPSGLQATGQYEVEDYEQTIKPIRKDFRLLLNRWFEMTIYSEYPDRKDLTVKVMFNPFVSPKAAEVQQMDSQRASMVCQLSMNGMITVSEGRAILRQGEDNSFDILSATTPDLLKKIEDMKDPEKQQQMQMQAQMAAQGGGMPVAGGMPGAGGAPAPQPENPEFAANKGVFQSAVQEVLAATGKGGESGGGVFSQAVKEVDGGGEGGGEAQPPQPEGQGGPNPSDSQQEQLAALAQAVGETKPEQ